MSDDITTQSVSGPPQRPVGIQVNLGQAATRSAIVAAVRARLDRVFINEAGDCRDCGWSTNNHADSCLYTRITAELSALERTVAADGEGAE